MSFDHLHPFLTFALAAAVWITLVLVCLWPFRNPRVMDRIPFVLTVASIPLELAVMTAPTGMERLFGLILGHSIYFKEREDAWMWINKWQGGVASAFRWVVLLGGIWALVNLFRGRSKVLNAIAIVFVGIFLYISFHVGL